MVPRALNFLCYTYISIYKIELTFFSYKYNLYSGKEDYKFLRLFGNDTRDKIFAIIYDVTYIIPKFL